MDKFTKFQHQESILKAKYEREIIDLNKNLNDLDTKLQEQMIENERLSTNRMFLFNREKEANLKVQELQASILNLKKEQASQSLEYSNQIRKLDEKLTDVVLEKDRQTQQFQQESIALKSSNSLLENKLHLFEIEISKLKEQIEQKDQIIKSLSRETALPRDVDKNDFELIKKQFKQQEKTILELELKNKKLCEQNSFLVAIQENNNKLNEEKLSLESKLVLMHKISKDLNEAKVEIEKFQREKQEWTRYLKNDGDSPIAMSRLISDQRLEIATQKEEIGRLKSEKLVKSNSLAFESDHHKELEQQIQVLKEETLSLKNQIKSISREREFAEKQSMLLREQLKSYEMEESLNNPNFDSQKYNRITELESTVAEYSERIKKLTQETQKTNLLVAENKQLEKTVEALSLQLDQFFQNSSDFDPTKTRVVMMKDNPLSTAEKARKEQLNALKAENQSLRNNLNAIPKESLNVLEQEISELKKEVEAKDKRVLRLKQVFGQKVSQYVEAVKETLGYKVELLEEKVKLFSVYSHSDDPYFVYYLNTHEVEIIGGSKERSEFINKLSADWFETGPLCAILASLTIGFVKNAKK